MRTRNDRSQAGYNLIEVLIAMALLGVVIVSIAGLFTWGRRNVYSGKQMTKANAVGTRVLEDLSYMTLQDVERNFGLTDASTTASNTVAGTVYPDSIVFTTTNIVSDPQGFLGRWKALVGTNEVTNGYVNLIVTPAGYVDASTKFSTAQFIRLAVVVGWNETASKARFRTIVLNTAKNVNG